MQDVRCPKCQRRNRGDARFCVSCGNARFREATHARTVWGDPVQYGTAPPQSTAWRKVAIGVCALLVGLIVLGVVVAATEEPETEWGPSVITPANPPQLEWYEEAVNTTWEGFTWLLDLLVPDHWSDNMESFLWGEDGPPFRVSQGEWNRWVHDELLPRASLDVGMELSCPSVRFPAPPASDPYGDFLSDFEAALERCVLQSPTGPTWAGPGDWQ